MAAIIGKMLKSATPKQSKSSSLSVKSLSLEVPEISPSSVKFLKLLGAEAFEKRYIGLLEDKPSGGPSVKVTIRALKENAPDMACSDFLQEIEFLSNLRHPNIICLLGVVTPSSPLCMLLEYIPQQNCLQSFLISKRADSEALASDHSSSQHALTDVDLCNISMQIAAGMDYLDSKCLLYNVLMASNCYIGENLQVKLSESEIIRDRECAPEEGLIPLRWMPPEMLSNRKITIEVNIWSYGVVLWEIYSFGKQPYPGLGVQEVCVKIKSHELNKCPDGCPPHAYDLMLKCWHEAPTKRPSFGDVTRQLQSWQDINP